MSEQTFDYLISAAATLRRNFADLPFVGKMEEAQRTVCLNRAVAALDGLSDTYLLFPAAELKEQQLGPLVEFDLLDADFPKQQDAFLLLRTDLQALVIVGLEDHLQIIVRHPQGDAQAAFDQAQAIAAALERQQPFSRDGQFGFLTARPRFAGLAAHWRLLLHLPMLTMLQQARGLAASAAQSDFSLLPLHPNEDKNPGALFRLQNAATTYADWAELTKAVEARRAILEDKESKLCERVMKSGGRSAYIDQVFRAWGTLQYARRLTYGEFLQLWSRLRLGVMAGLIPLPLHKADALLHLAQKHKLLKDNLNEADDRAVNFLRADIVRHTIKGG